jgi:stage V sporulation protein B
MKKTSLGRGTIYLTLSTIIFVLSSYIVNVWLGRYLGPSGYGVYGVIISLLTAINLTQTSGLPLAVAKYIAQDEDRADGILRSGLIVQTVSTLLASLLFFFLAQPLAHLLNDMSLVPYIQLCALVFPLYGVYSVYLNYYNGLHHFKTQAMMSIIYSIAKFVCIIGLVYFLHVYGAILGFVFAPVIALMFYLHLPKKNANRFPYKKLILFSLPLTFIAIFSNLLQSVDLFFIKGMMHSDASTGIYTANQNIAEIPFYGITALASVLFPGISRSISQNLPDQTRSLIVKSLRFTWLIITPSIFLIAATSGEILQFLYSAKYISGASSLSILAMASGLFTLFTMLATILSSSGSPWMSSILSGTGLAINSILCLFLIPLYGISGAAIATTIAVGIVMLIAAFLVYRKFQVLFDASSVLKILLASSVIFLLGKVIIIPVIILPLLYIALFIVYGAMLYLLKEIKKEDMLLVQSLLPSWISRKK